MMNILVSTTIFPNSIEINRGIYIKKQVLSLSKINNIKIKVIAPIPYVPHKLKLKKYIKYNHIPSKEIVDGFEIYHPKYFILPKAFRSLHGIFFFISLLKFYLDVIKRFSPDIILGFWTYPDGFANVLFAKMMSIPVIIGCLGSDINRYKNYFFHRKMITWSLGEADKILVVSNALKEEVVKLGIEPNKVKVIPNGIESDIFFPKNRDEIKEKLKLNLNERIVLCVARLSAEKGVDKLIKAFSKLKRNEVKLLIIGDGPEKKKLMELTQQMGLNGRVNFIGERPQREISDWINASDILCLPSLSEGWPNVLMEAFACGKPVVASRVGGVPEIITSDKLGIMVPPGDIEKLAEGIEQALKTSWNSQLIRSSVAHRTWDIVAQEIYEVVTDVLRKSEYRNTKSETIIK